MKYKSGEYEEVINKLITSKGGIRKQNDFVRSTIKICVICENGHDFTITPAKIQQGRWCPECRRVPFEKN